MCVRISHGLGWDSFCVSVHTSTTNARKRILAEKFDAMLTEHCNSNTFKQWADFSMHCVRRTVRSQMHSENSLSNRQQIFSLKISK